MGWDPDVIWLYMIPGLVLGVGVGAAIPRWTVLALCLVAALALQIVVYQGFIYCDDDTVCIMWAGLLTFYFTLPLAVGVASGICARRGFR